ncbi:hypothetical protein GpartN1_g5084.t1 [Galdieria partita]|uniref:Malonyl-CoA decarboxylase C-terminal domain-containing protein n=1 Tax=Galdieria partita TaxID=83374 RepID=A0A9C7PYU0_9RHOD|nr:hypothetical protein GpartN1_g5084.t1 [Galdieria partita]
MLALLCRTSRLWKCGFQYMKQTVNTLQHKGAVVDRFVRQRQIPVANQFTTGTGTAPVRICHQYTNCLIDCIRNLEKNHESNQKLFQLEKQRQEASKQLLSCFQQLAEEPTLSKRFSTELLQRLMKVYSSTSANQYFVIYLAQDLIETAASLQGSRSLDSIHKETAGLYRNGQSEHVVDKHFQSFDMEDSTCWLQSQSVLPQVFSHMYEVEGALAFLHEIWKDVSLQMKHIEPKDPLLMKLSYFKRVLETEMEKHCSPQLFEVVRVLPSSPDYILNSYLEEMSWKGNVKPSERQLNLQRLENGHRCYALMHQTEPRKPLAFCQLAFLPFVPSNMNDIMAFAKEPKEDSSHSLPVAVIYGIKAMSSSYGEGVYRSFLKKLFQEQLRAIYPPIKGIVTHSRSFMFISWLQDQLYIMDHFSSLPNRQRQLVVKWDCLDRLRPVLQLCSGTVPSYIPQAEWMKNITSEIQHHKDDLLSLFAYFVVRGWKFSPFMDPSILFHIRCGAELYQINWMGERTWDALRSCAGITFNFLYSADDMESNLQAYVDRGEVVVSEQVMEHLNRGVVVEKIVDVEK